MIPKFSAAAHVTGPPLSQFTVPERPSLGLSLGVLCLSDPPPLTLQSSLWAAWVGCSWKQQGSAASARDQVTGIRGRATGGSPHTPTRSEAGSSDRNSALLSREQGSVSLGCSLGGRWLSDLCMSTSGAFCGFSEFSCVLESSPFSKDKVRVS